MWNIIPSQDLSSYLTYAQLPRTLGFQDWVSTLFRRTLACDANAVIDRSVKAEEPTEKLHQHAENSLLLFAVAPVPREP